MPNTGHAGDRPSATSLPAAQTGAKSWTPDQLAFQAWLAVPSAVREPRSQQELARQLERDPATLSSWKKLPGFADAVYVLAVERVVADLVPVLHAQVAQAKKGSLPHAQWLFELVGKWSPKQRLEHTGGTGGPLRIVIETVDDRGPPDVLMPAPSARLR